ncbi:hypothetical protein [Vibrio crassostreae]|uniref:hypothetical protein n=1 Tax=Vibrio crassostreae TaxID=246167 RepID=UPI001051BAF4|nr:hypothetical protein [Vibrio crassostreae]TCO05243.1 hypothetical protein EDB51_101250 [Vibrio crassostreae]CAK1847893.1 Chromosome partitioning protein ParA [Vibrio crassostreae]CAK1856355.1 Chromosome partitioning protein ParA [Vibrio crassostreae]CAK1857670.1 Chromosome partitioning protein ParA [Vibrio crassostreae]CAK2649881.1 Chromosome partitioning protein ParA [Vibrio crassostreae]
MLFKKTAVSTSILAALLLAGCGGSSDTKQDDEIVTQTQGQFIDAAVEGLYYVAQPSGKAGFTDRDGKYEFEANDTITFFLGGENGLRIGKASARSIVSPFEATGNYQKAVNLARILQTIGDTTSDFITLPQDVIAPSASTITALNNVSLHDMTSAESLLEELELEDWISEEEALEHLENSLAGLERGSNDLLTDWQRGSGKYMRSISSSLSYQNDAQAIEVYNIHADKLLESGNFEEGIFKATQGVKTMNFRLDESDLIMLAGSNDSSLGGTLASQYLNCLADGGDAEVSQNDQGWNIIKCDGVDMPVQPEPDSPFILGDHFSYSLVNPQEELDQDSDESWDEVTQFGPLYACMADKSCTENALTGFYIAEYDDSDEQDDSGWRKDILNTSYDAVTGVFTEVRKRTSGSEEGIYDGRISHSLGFSYLVDSSESDRYVNFEGTWNAVATRAGCDNVATSTYVFDATGLTMAGEEFYSGCETEELEPEHYSYAELAEMDYWWFTTNEKDSQATLTQLNSTIRWCDIDEDEVDNGNCNNGADTKINRWEYAPAGADWDQGILNRRTLDSDGSVRSSVSMYKD